MIALAILCFNFAGTFSDSIDEYDVAAQVKVDNNYVYIYRTISENKIKYENIFDSKEIPLKDGKIYLRSYNGANIALWVCFVILVIIIIIATLIGINDDDLGWELDDVWKEAFGTLIYCEEENGVYYYFALGRLIEKRNNQAPRNYGICSELRISGFRELYRCPKYQTKSQKRETLLNKIGIN
jgi:hypothetical protein